MAPLIALGITLAKEFAPDLIKRFSGDGAGAVAEKVIGIAQAITGKTQPQEALETLRADPALAVQFKQSVMAHEEVLERIASEDRSDARRRDVDLAKLGKTNSRANWMVAGDVFGLVSCLAVLVFFGVFADSSLPGEIVSLITVIATNFALCLRDAHQFEFGSSRGSRDKDLLNAQR